MKKDIKFSTRMASADREKIKALAAKAGMSMSDYVTACCLGKRIVVIDVGEGPIILINPEILETSGEQTGEEGCLSVPDKWLPVSRPNRVKVRALNRFGKSFTMEGEGLLARAFCHEIDHLDGRLFIDVYRDQQKEHKSEAAAQTEPDEKKS